MNYDYKVNNKQVNLKTIEKIANYIEDLKEDFKVKFEKDDYKNQNVKYFDRVYEYGKGEVKAIYEIEYINGENIKNDSFDWFVSNFNKPRDIKYMGIRLEISFSTTHQDKRELGEKNNEYNSISINIKIGENDIGIYGNSFKQDEMTNKIFNQIINFFNENEDRANKTIKYRRIRTFCFCTAVGIIFLYIIYLLLKLNITTLPDEIKILLDNKRIFALIQWFIALSFGHLLGMPYIELLYKNIAPKISYVGYKNELGFYVKESETHIGKYWNAEQKRRKIEKIYVVSKIIIIIQLVISLFSIVK